MSEEEENLYDISDIDLTKINDKRHDLEKIAQVKWLLEIGLPVNGISEAMDIPAGTVSQIRQGITHKEVTPAFPVNLISENDIPIVKDRIKFLQAIANHPHKKPVMKRRFEQ